MIAKECRDCGISKALTEFPPRKERSDGRGSYCTPCMNERSKASYRKLRAEYGRAVREKLTMPGHRRCPDCGDIKTLDEFPRSKNASEGRAAYCKPCHNARGRASKEKVGGSRTYHLKRRYGISALEFEAMAEAQGGLCLICQERPAEHVDHCHATGAVRGLLCFNCNGGLGQFRDRVDILRNAIEYLEGFGG